MKNCFLNCAFTDGENKVYEVVKFDDAVPLETTLEYHDEDGLVQLLANKEYRFDFGVRNGYLVWGPNSPMVQDRPETLNNLLNTKQIEFRNGIKTVYDLLYQLVDLKAVFIDYLLLQDKDPGNLGELAIDGQGYTNFKELKVSKTTMNVYFTISTTEGMRTRSLIGIKDGVLEFTSFAFGIDANKYQPFPDDYPIEVLGPATLNGRDLIVCRLHDGMSIYPMMLPYFRIFDPVLHHKIYHSEQYKITSKFVAYTITSIMNAIMEDGDGAAEKETERPSHDTTHVTDRRYGVNFRLKIKPPSYSDYSIMLKFVTDLYEEVVKEQLTMKDIIARVNKKYEAYNSFACMVALQSFMTGKTLLDRVDKLKAVREELKLKIIRLDLELFVYRAYIYFSDHKLPYGVDTYEMIGGTSPYISELKKNIKRW